MIRTWLTVSLSLTLVLFKICVGPVHLYPIKHTDYVMKLTNMIQVPRSKSRVRNLTLVSISSINGTCLSNSCAFDSKMLTFAFLFSKKKTATRMNLLHVMGHVFRVSNPSAIVYPSLDPANNLR